jgi:hypothetical protein
VLVEDIITTGGGILADEVKNQVNNSCTGALVGKATTGGYSLALLKMDGIT